MRFRGVLRLLAVGALATVGLLSASPALAQARPGHAAHSRRHTARRHSVRCRRHTRARHRRCTRRVKHKRHRRKKAPAKPPATVTAATPTAVNAPPSLPSGPASVSPVPGLAAVPYMGWNTYYGVGGGFDEQTVKDVANALINRGLAQAGYKIVWLDFGWASGARDSGGNLIVDSSQWPDGMASLTAWLHQHGLEAGIYTDAGSSGCSGQGVGSLGHYQQDADQFAAWGFDAVKVDFCGGGQAGMAPQQAYADFANALQNNASARPMILNVCNFWVPGQINGTLPTLANSSFANYQWAPAIAQSWRTDTDIGFTKNVVFSNVLRNLDRDAADPEAAGPGHWNDPDYLAPELGMSATEAQSQFSMWAMVAAPLILGSDPRSLSDADVTMLENPQVIAVDQDPLGIQGALLTLTGSIQVWVKPLADGARAVALFNRGTASAQITTTARGVGLPAASQYHLTDLWANTASTTAGTITATVPAHGVALYRVSAG
jgi:alpha-galactosidase